MSRTGVANRGITGGVGEKDPSAFNSGAIPAMVTARQAETATGDVEVAPMFPRLT